MILIIHWITFRIVELPEFIRRSKKLLSEQEHNKLLLYLSTHPKSGYIIVGTGGMRKIRWAREGFGKSSGVRVIYYFHDKNIPLFILAVFAKNEKISLSKSERNELSNLVKHIVKNYKGNKSNELSI